MLLLVSLFFTLLALYIFIRIINRIQALEFDTGQKKRQEDTSLKDPGLEEEIKQSEKTGSDLWLMITVTAWLLLPIFKPVDDERINLYEPYKTLTLGSGEGGIPPALTATPRQGTNDTIRVVTTFDTVKVQLVDTAGRNLDSASVMRLLHEITNNVKDVKGQLQK
jgi:hypothetical protein